jgi:hypothetical protein
VSTDEQRPEAVAQRIRDAFPEMLRGRGPARVPRSTRARHGAILGRMGPANDELVRTSFDAFLAGDWEALSRVMAPDVQWLWHEPCDRDCHDRRTVLAALLERQREGVVTGLNRVVAVDDRVYVEITGPRLTEGDWRAGKRAWSSRSVRGASCACRTTQAAPPRSPAQACRPSRPPATMSPRTT